VVADRQGDEFEARVRFANDPEFRLTQLYRWTLATSWLRAEGCKEAAN
jgi:hypothetical protein